MGVIALDTNVLVRLLTRDDPEQAESARQLFEKHSGEDGGLFVSDVVLAELAWTLDRAYRRGRAEISGALRSLLRNATLSFQSRETVRAALGLFETGSAGFPDCLIVATAAAQGCRTVVTFDRGMASMPAVQVL